MGIINPDGFAGGRMKLDKNLSLQAFESLDSQLSLDDRVRFAFYIGVNNIAEGLTNVAIQHGIDPRDYSIVAFGAAGPMLLPAALSRVHAAEVIVPPHPGLFSALGLVSSEQTYSDSRSAYKVLSAEAADEINEVLNEMEEQLRKRFAGRHPDPTFVRSFDGRLLGQSWETPFIPIPPGRVTPDTIETMIANFHDVYESRSGNRFPAMPVQGVTYRVATIIPTAKVEYPRISRRKSGKPCSVGNIELRYFENEPIQVPEYRRADLRHNDVIEGPAIIREDTSTTFMLPKQVLSVGEYGELYISRAG
jgi:N-methylhydantoinase A